MKFRGEKLGQLLKFKRFNKEAFKIYKNPEDWEGVTIEQWVEGLKFPETYKTEILYPFLGATLGTTIPEIKLASTVDIVKLFAFRKPKASSQFKVVKEGMGTLIQRVGESFPKEQIETRLNSAVTKMIRDGEQWEITYLVNGKEHKDHADFVVLCTHAYQAEKILSHDSNFTSVTAALQKLGYFEAKIALHTDESYANTEKPAFLNIYTDQNNQLTSSTMNLSMISERLTGIYKSWVSDEAIEELRQSGKLLSMTLFYHPLITSEFVKDLGDMRKALEEFPSLYIAGGWSEGLETQNSAVVSGKKALEKYKQFKK